MTPKILGTCVCFMSMLALFQISSCTKDNSNLAASNNSVSAESEDDLSAVSLTKGLIALYNFNGDTLDHSGNNNNVIFNSAKPAKGKSGLAKTAYVFDGTSSYMQVNNSETLNPNGKISLYALVKPTGFYQGPCHSNRILSKGYSDFANGRYTLGFDDMPYYNWNGCTEAVQTKFENFYASFGNGFDVVGNTDTTVYIKTNVWYSLVYTFDGKNSKLYINNKLVSNTNKPTTFSSNSSPLYIGRNQDAGNPYYFKGAIDEIRIYNRALNASEVSLLYMKK